MLWFKKKLACYFCSLVFFVNNSSPPAQIEPLAVFLSRLYYILVHVKFGWLTRCLANASLNFISIQEVWRSKMNSCVNNFMRIRLQTLDSLWTLIWIIYLRGCCFHIWTIFQQFFADFFFVAVLLLLLLIICQKYNSSIFFNIDVIISLTWFGPLEDSLFYCSPPE